MASFTTFIEPLQLHQQTQLHLSSFSHCKYSSSLNAFRFHVSFKVRLATNPQTRFSRNKRNSAAPTADFSSGISSFTDINTRAGEKLVLENDRGVGEPNGRRVVLKDRHAKTGLRSERGKERGSRVPSVRFKGKNFVADAEKTQTLKEGHGDMDKRSAKCGNSRKKVEQRERRVKKPKVDSPGATLRVGLDMCSKRGDVVGAIMLYELAKREGIKMGQYHYAVLLYLCSSAATGVVQPAKSGSGARSLSHAEPLKQSLVVGAESLSEFGRMAERDYDRSELWVRKSEGEYVIEHLDRDEVNMDSTLDGLPSSDLYGGEVDMRDFINGSTEFSHQTLDGLVESMKKRVDSSNTKNDAGEGYGIQVSEDVKRVALQKGFEIYNELRAEQVAMNEATFTSVARMAMAFGDGDMAFDMVKQMKEYGINPRLRSYGPALAIFCGNGDVEKAFVVEEHMLEHGVYPEEPELEALLKVSMKAGKSDKVYYVLHKLRTSVRQVSPATADVIERWFNSKVASRVGKRKWDQESVIRAMGNGGGGWHGKGWLGKGKWTVSRSFVGSNGLCKSCGEKLVTIDLDPEETENFAKSVASMAAQREKHLSFEKFQKWLDYYGPFEAVVDAANVGLYSQRNFKPSKVNAVVNGIRQMLPSRKWPLIILHNRRITGQKMEEPFNKALIEKWKNADALYATPTGSNDDWYWLYAAIKCKCLLVTNDEMRDHLFQLLGNDFFPRWKERHQVRFSFDETGPVFRMPPPCSVVIQESAKGHWHIPIASEVENENERIWLCCTRANSSLTVQDSDDEQTDSHITHQKKGEQRIGARQKYTAESKQSGVDNHDEGVGKLEEQSANVKAVVLSSVSRCHGSIIPQLEAAEKDGACLVDFQI